MGQSLSHFPSYVCHITSFMYGWGKKKDDSGLTYQLEPMYPGPRSPLPSAYTMENSVQPQQASEAPSHPNGQREASPYSTGGRVQADGWGSSLGFTPLASWLG